MGGLQIVVDTACSLRPLADLAGDRLFFPNSLNFITPPYSAVRHYETSIAFNPLGVGLLIDIREVFSNNTLLFL
jgi:hypothetical protein